MEVEILNLSIQFEHVHLFVSASLWFCCFKLLVLIITKCLRIRAAVIKVDEIMSVSKALLEMEAWEGDVILTTFVQLFQSIFTDRNSALKI